ncbi:hypothetical protein OT_ostta02g00087 [Ostreococcus tauri]|uniref:Uncharacterized protein n=1 Tax=Ostreococcus tauri TaxID=70448 RepID=A0A090MDB8_OSTTA|nr:hypothetical protein OT_ostta02g00087 [Ostreococcus tauri]CEG00901.1 hypothetical protein OT_ostta02g00087 [Ostreococcus tauri]|eukprot:XP_022840658.1 hypothetical protein OT_ostta02g00087 [Ostreococcus tauri]
MIPELDNFRRWAKLMAEREVTDFNTIDGSPNLQTLHREIDWLISDNIASVQGFGQSLNSVKHVSSLLNSSELYSVTLRLSIEELEHLWRKRTMERVPLQYLTHTAHWRDLELTVSDAVLIPRPETELLGARVYNHSLDRARDGKGSQVVPESCVGLRIQRARLRASSSSELSRRDER